MIKYYKKVLLLILFFCIKEKSVDIIDAAQKGMATLEKKKDLLPQKASSVIDKGNQVLSKIADIKNLIVEDNELQVMKKDLEKIKQETKNKNNQKNNPIIKINNQIVQLTEQMNSLLEDYTESNEKLKSIINITSNLERKILSKDELNTELINLFNLEEFTEDSLIIYITNALLTLDESLNYKKNSYIKKNNGMKKTFLRLNVIYKSLCDILLDTNSLNMI